MSGSLQRRLLIRVTGTVLLLLIVFSAGVYVTVRAALLGQFDTSLTSIAQVLAASVEIDGELVEIEFEVQQMPEFRDHQRPTCYQLWRADGRVVARAPLLDKDDLPSLQGSVAKPTYRTIHRDGSRIERAVGFAFAPRRSDSGPQSTDEQDMTLVVARDITGVLAQLRFLRGVLLAATAIVTGLSVAAASGAIHQGLRPLKTMAEQIAAIGEHDLGARVGPGAPPPELLPIRDRLNDLLSRLEAAFRRERQFTSDVAHELRTPLAGIRSTIEVNLAKRRDADEYRSALSECLMIAQGMQTMVDNLLTLTRLDGQRVNLRIERIDLAELVDSCWRRFADKAARRNIAFENRTGTQIVCQSDRENLAIVLANVLGNAVEYTNERGWIRADAHPGQGVIEIAVANSGCELSQEQASHVFESFWRGDWARTQTGTHCGLGLALVAKMIEALGGSASAEAEAATFTLRLVLPADDGRPGVMETRTQPGMSSITHLRPKE